jgi:hypothetical protein
MGFLKFSRGFGFPISINIGCGTGEGAGRGAAGSRIFPIMDQSQITDFDG